MDKQVEWKLWSVQEILGNLTRFINLVKSSRDDFPEEHREKNVEAAESLERDKPTVVEIREEKRHDELITLGFALDYLANNVGKQWKIEHRLLLFQAAHEFFRGGKPLHPTKPMRLTLNNAWRAMLAHEMQNIQDGEIDAGLVLDGINTFVVSAWGYIPPQLAQSINETMLTTLESIRATHEEDRMFHEQFVRNNIEVVLTMDVPTRLEKIQDQWRELGEYLAPSATRSAVRKFERPRPLSTLLAQDVWDEIKQALVLGDGRALLHALEPVEDALEANLRLRLDARPDYCEPAAEIRINGQPDRFFSKAHGLLLQQNPDALKEFRNIYFHKTNVPIVKEWYAYALSKFGQKTDIHEIVDQLEDAIKSTSYRSDTGWTARWNLACALRNLPARSDEALDYLLPVLENDTHSTGAFELCLLWALDQEREDILQALLIKSPFYEAHMLAALNAIEAQNAGEAGDENGLRDHFRRLNYILQNPDHVIPDPKEDLKFAELGKLSRHFAETLLIDAGIEWFRQRLSYERERYNWKNWECLSELSERAGDYKSAWRYTRQQWTITARNTKLLPAQKTPMLRNLMSWAERYSFEEEALRLLKQYWKNTSLTELDVRSLELRLKRTSPELKAVGPERISTPEKPEKPTQTQQLTPQEADRVVQRVAGLFRSVGSADALAERAEDAQSLIAATLVKHPTIESAGQAAIAAMREVIRLANVYKAGVDDQKAQTLSRQMREQLVPLQNGREALPFDISSLAQACERVIQNTATRLRDVPDIQLSPLEALKNALDTPIPGESYQTRVFVRLTNPGQEDMRDINVAFIPQSAYLQFEEKSILLPLIGPGEKRIVEGLLEVNDGVEHEVTIRIHVSYTYGGVARAVQHASRVPVRSLEQAIPFAERYMTGKPVSVERPDLFHGRNKELKELMSTFAGGRLLKLYFVNGIRRVGKSTLMEQLAGHCGPDILPLVLNLQDVVQEDSTPIQLVNQLIRLSIAQVQRRDDLPPLTIARPSLSAFEMDPPWVVFETFLDELLLQCRRKSVLLCFDEVPFLVKLIADPRSSINEGFLAWMRSKVQTPSNILLICTGSEVYSTMRKRYEHTLWGNMEAYNISFVDRAAMEQIATLPVKRDDVTWLPEALDRLWDMTEGHPWIIQIVAENATRQLNLERRRLVGPGDVDRAVEEAAYDERTTGYWWNEQEGQVTETHRQIAFLLLQHQPASRVGLAESALAELCQKSGIRLPGRYMDEMRNLEILTDFRQGNETHWRIKGAFLERFLNTLMVRVMQGNGAKPVVTQNQSLALMLDWENVKISLLEILKALPPSRSQALRQRVAGPELANCLLEAASQHGQLRQKWAIANWDRPTFAGDQAALKRLRYMPDMAGEQKDDASDHVLVEKIHYVLREHPDIDTYVIGTGDGDFGEVIKTLQEKGKHVVLWATKKALNDVYKYYLQGPDGIQVEWLEQIVFGKDL